MKDNVSASVRYGLDERSLYKQGLMKEQIDRLHKALYVHTMGFYGTVTEITRSSKNRKNIIVGVMRIYQQLLEKCAKNDWKMLINEVAHEYE